jgi:AcrR family transcriptional regulator
MAGQRTRHRKGDETKGRILEAARRRFSEEGYERTTIRAVATDASIDPSMVMRYFGSKEALFAAAASFDLHLPDLTVVARTQRGDRLARHYLNLWDCERGGGLHILLRAAATNDAAAGRVRDIFEGQVLPVVAAVVPDAPSTRAGLIASQLLGLAYCRYVLDFPALTRVSETVLVANLGRTLQRYLHDPIIGA